MPILIRTQGKNMLSCGCTNYRTSGENLRRQIVSLAGRRVLLYPFYKQQRHREGRQFAQVNAGSVVMMGDKNSLPRSEPSPIDTGTSTSSEKQPHGEPCTACFAPVLLQ